MLGWFLSRSAWTLPGHHTGLLLIGRLPGTFQEVHIFPFSARNHGFQVCLIHDIDAVLIAETVPKALVGVVAGANRIDVVALQDFRYHGAYPV